jgi:DNA-directed RNA polymerase subunit RPC12/RpoP
VLPYPFHVLWFLCLRDGQIRFAAVYVYCGNFSVHCGFKYNLPSHISKGFRTVQYTTLSFRGFVSLIVLLNEYITRSNIQLHYLSFFQLQVHSSVRAHKALISIISYVCISCRTDCANTPSSDSSMPQVVLCLYCGFNYLLPSHDSVVSYCTIH